MHKLVFGIILTVLLLGCDHKGSFVKTIESQNDIHTAVEKFKNLIESKGLTHFYTIDHSQNASEVNMNLKPEILVVFGNPKMGTVLMNCNPSIGLDLPLHMLFTTNYEGLTSISYTNPEYWSLKHNIKDKNCLSIINKAKIALDALAEAAGKK